MRSKKFYYSVIIVSLAIVSLSIYYVLGGFDPVEVFPMEGKSRTVIGKEYLEKYYYADFKARIEEAKAAVDSGKLEGMLAVIFYQNDTIGIDSAHYFIGAAIDDQPDVIRVPPGYEYKEFSTDRVYKVFMTQHPIVRPRPEKVAELACAEAEKEGKELYPFSFELYYSDGSFSVEFWAR